MLVLVIPLMSRHIWKGYLKTTLHYLGFSSHGFNAGDPGIKYPKINPEAGYVDDTCFRRLQGLGYS